MKTLHTKKRTILSTVVVALVIGVTSLVTIPQILKTENAAAAGTMTITFTASTTTPTVGSNVTVTTNMSTADTPINTMQVRYDYDKTKLEFVSQNTTGTLFSNGCVYANNNATNNLPNFGCSDTSTTLRASKMASVVFKVLAAGSTTVTGVPSNNQSVDQNFQVYTTVHVPVTINAGTPTVSTDPNLKGLTVSAGTLSPAFSGNTTSYTVSVPNTTTSINITATAPTGGSKSGDGTKTLNVGSNPFTIVSTAEDGTTKKNYTVTVTRASAPVLSTNNNLSSLGISGYTIAPAFSATNTGPYTLSVPNAASTVNVTATAADSKATLTGVGSKSLNVGNNTLTVVVTAENGDKKTYTINVERAAAEVVTPPKSSNSSLKSLSIGGTTISPAFSPSTTQYSASVGNGTTSLDVSAVVNDPKATVAISGNTNLKVGVNNVHVTVTAEDGSKTNYTIVVTRAAAPDAPSVPSTSGKSSDNTLSDITDTTGLNLFKNFSPSTTTYTIDVPYEIDKLGLIANTTNGKAKVEVIGDGNFKVGMNTVTIKVTAEDGSERIYTINVNRSPASGALSLLTLGGAKLSPEFNTAVRHYSTSVPHNQECLEIFAHPTNPEAKVTVTGDCGLKSGTNLVRISVEYEAGKFADYYIEVDKAYPPTILGIPVWLFWLLLALFLALIGAIIFLLLRKRRRAVVASNKNTVDDDDDASTIIFRPEFNFGSKNNEDSQNDSVSGSHSNMSQDAAIDDADVNRLGPSSDLIAPGRNISANPEQIKQDTLDASK